MGIIQQKRPNKPRPVASPPANVAAGTAVVKSTEPTATTPRQLPAAIAAPPKLPAAKVTPPQLPEAVVASPKLPETVAASAKVPEVVTTAASQPPSVVVGASQQPPVKQLEIASKLAGVAASPTPTAAPQSQSAVDLMPTVATTELKAATPQVPESSQKPAEPLKTVAAATVVTPVASETEPPTPKITAAGKGERTSDNECDGGRDIVDTVEITLAGKLHGLNIVPDKSGESQETITRPSIDRVEEKDSDTLKDDDLGSQLRNLTLADDDEDVNVIKQLKELKIKEKQEEKSDDTDLVARGGPIRPHIKGNREKPYVVEQHYVASDNHGGATVLYPNFPQQMFPNNHNVQPQNISNSYWKLFESETGRLTCSNLQNFLPSQNDIEGLSELTEEQWNIIDKCLEKICNGSDDNQTNIFLQNGTHHCSQPLFDEKSSDSFGFDIDEIIESDKYDKSLPDVKQELSKEPIYTQIEPTTPDSAYDSDEGTIGSPASTTSVGLQRETENVHPVYSPGSSVMPQNNFLQQTGFPAASVSPVLQTVPPNMVLFVQQNSPSIITTNTIQSLITPVTPPPTYAPRPILPGVNIPPPCNEPAIKRIASVMTEKVKDTVWALIFTKPDSDFTVVDEEGNTVLAYMLSNRHKYKNFMEVFHVTIQRIKRIIKRNKEMAHKLLAAPNRCGHTPLDLACRYFQSTEQDALVVRYLADTMVEEGLDIGKECEINGDTLLHKICSYGDKARFIMAELLSVKDRSGNTVFNVNKGNNERKTPLHIVALKHSEQTPCTVLAQLLMRSGALASEQEGCSGNTVFHCVASVSCDPNLLVTLLAKTKNVETIVNQTNFNGDTPLHMVAANPNITLERQRLAVEHLIHYGAQPRLSNKSGKAPLSLVAAERKQDIKTVLYHR